MTIEDPAVGHGATLHLLSRNIFRGPNVFGRRPMIRLQIDLGILEGWPTDRLPDFRDALLTILPGLAGHGCSCRHEGGFARRLTEGTWLGHVIEHVALELQTLAGSPVSRGKTRSVAGRPGVYNILFAYRDEALALAAARAAIDIVTGLLPPAFRSWEGAALLPAAKSDNALDIAEVVTNLVALRKTSELGPSTASLVDAARRRTVPVTRLDGQSRYGSRQQRIRASITGRTSQIGVTLAGNKDATKAILASLGLPVPAGYVSRTAEEALAAARKLGGAVVVKPLDGNHGRGVTTALNDEEAISAAFGLAAKICTKVIIERHLPGHDYRALVIGGKLVAVAERVPAHIIGDGTHTVAELIAHLNDDPRRGLGHEAVLTRIRVDQALEDLLARDGRALADIPAQGERVLLRGTANLSSGGTAIDRTDEIHPENRLVAEMAATALGLDVAGIDLLSPDIARPLRETGGGIVEVNAAPGLRMHLAPSQGAARDVAAPIISTLFPDDTPSRIPIVAITGTNGKSTTARMVATILRTTFPTVGLTSTNGVYVNDLLLRAGDASGPKSARMLLQNPAVDVAVLETARGGILREGLGFDYCTVGAVLNVSEDHLGVAGVNTLEDLAAVKSVVIRSVARRGAAVLNFDDPFVRKLARRSRAPIIWFSRSARTDNPLLAEHLRHGGRAVLLESDDPDATLYLHCEGKAIALLAGGEIPGTLGGAAGFNVENALAASAIATALGVAPERIASALRTFASNFDDNPGRFNIIDDHPFRVIIDYAHNVASMRAFGRCLAQLKAPQGRTIGMVSMPGDRRDDDIVEMGAVAVPMFDQIVFREGPDGRDRPRGDVLRLLERGAREAGANGGELHFVLEERDAVTASLELAGPGDLVVLFPTRVEETYGQVKAFKPVTVPVEGPIHADV
ncbi:cyanophycin synthetase [Sphingobium yanoikuyae]|uniref:cyanophycin synthetase n=1 Tax=Sphingobium yanoikuyae TaxID=13690 RepID=UPI0022DDFDCC|nr:cyanophycin synthetase [Sphingobium yanoikuyae]WBQ19148.1 cyanophycin synthetase [Sphingobium yanoikuyae]